MKKMLVFSTLLLCATVLQATAPRVMGPGGGGRWYRQVINPQDDNNMIIMSDMGTHYTTVDGGQSWHPHQVGARYAFNPIDPNIIYAGNYISHDKGLSFEPFLQGVNGNIQCMIVNPLHTDSIWVITYASNLLTVYKSGDNGNLWTVHGTIPVTLSATINGTTYSGNYYSYMELLFDPETHRLYGLCLDGIIDVQNLAIIARPNMSGSITVNGGKLQFTVADKTTEPGDAHDTQLSQSTDAGATWTSISTNVDAANAPFIYNTGVRRVTTSGSKVYASIANNLIASDDNGAVWRKSVGYGTQGVINHSYAEYKENDLYPSFSWSALGDQWLQVSQTNPNLAFASSGYTHYITTDGGLTWNCSAGDEIGTGGVNYQKYRTRGSENNGGYNVVVDPFDPQHIFLCNIDNGLLESHDGGDTWQILRYRQGFKDYNTCYSLVFDPRQKDLIYIASSSVHDQQIGDFIAPTIERMIEWNGKANAVAAGDFGGVLKSADGGWTWKQTGSSDSRQLTNGHLPCGLPFPAQCTDITLDPRDGTLYVVCMGRGVYKSTDGGVTFTQFNTGMEDAKTQWGRTPLGDKRYIANIKTVFRLTWSNDSTRLYAVYLPAGSPSGNTTGSYLDLIPYKGPVYYVERGGSQWTELKTYPEASIPEYGLPQNSPEYINGVAAFYGVARNSNGTLFGGARRHGTMGNYGGLWMSKDDGQTWKKLFRSDVPVYDVMVDRDNENVIYITAPSKCYASYDGENTTFDSWREVTIPPASVPLRIIDDPVNPNYFYLATWGAGFWHIQDANAPGGTNVIISKMDLNPALSVYSGFANDNVTVGGANGKTVAMYNLMGKKVYECKSYNGQNISTAGWTSGVYVVKAGGATSKWIKK